VRRGRDAGGAAAAAGGQGPRAELGWACAFQASQRSAIFLGRRGPNLTAVLSPLPCSELALLVYVLCCSPSAGPAGQQPRAPASGASSSVRHRSSLRTEEPPAPGSLTGQGQGEGQGAWGGGGGGGGGGAGAKGTAVPIPSVPQGAGGCPLPRCAAARPGARGWSGLVAGGPRQHGGRGGEEGGEGAAGAAGPRGPQGGW